MHLTELPGPLKFAVIPGGLIKLDCVVPKGLLEWTMPVVSERCRSLSLQSSFWSNHTVTFLTAFEPKVCDSDSGIESLTILMCRRMYKKLQGQMNDGWN